MKEKYFTKENINQKTAEIIESVSQIVKVRIDIKIKSPALLILDMQKYFLDDNSHAFVPAAKAIVDKIVFLSNLFIDKGFPVIKTKHINKPDNAANMATWWNDLITKDKPESVLIEEIKKIDCDEIEKTQYDAFYHSGLGEILIKKKVDQLVITGVMTHLCCDTTARSAFIKDYEIFLPADGTATYNENFHLASLMNLAHGFARITTINELITHINDA